MPLFRYPSRARRSGNPMHRRGLGKPPKPINWFPGLKPGASLGQSILASVPKGGFTGLTGGDAAAGGAPGGGGSPYAGILQDYLNQSRADFAAESAADRGGMINALRRYAISYGALPDFSALGGLGGEAAGFFKEALDPNTRSLAEKAEKEGLSSHARLAHANQLITRKIPATLAARGILRSGQTGADLSEQALTYKQQGYDMLNELLSGITGTVSGFQENERMRQRELARLAQEAAFEAAQDWGDSYFDDVSEGATGMGGVPLRSFATRALGITKTPGIVRGRPTYPKPRYPSRRRRSGNPMHRRGL